MLDDGAVDSVFVCWASASGGGFGDHSLEDVVLREEESASKLLAAVFVLV